MCSGKYSDCERSSVFEFVRHERRPCDARPVSKDKCNGIEVELAGVEELVDLGEKFGKERFEVLRFLAS